MPGLLFKPVWLLDEILGFWFQARCLCCGKPVSHGMLCNGCVRFPVIDGHVCEICGDSLELKVATCGKCLVQPSLILKIQSRYWFSEDAKEFLHAVKYGGRSGVLSWFLNFKALPGPLVFPSDCTVIPVPLYFLNFWKRSFNQSELLARWICERWSLPLRIDSLLKIRLTRSQSTLSRKKRSLNLAGTFRWGKGNSPSKVLLVDDVYTTGATLEACAKQLRRTGTNEVYGWTLFRTPRKYV